MSVPRLCQLGISNGYPFDDLSGARTTPTGLVTPARVGSIRGDSASGRPAWIGNLWQDQFEVTDRVQVVEPAFCEVKIGQEAGSRWTLTPIHGAPRRGQELTVPGDCTPVP